MQNCADGRFRRAQTLPAIHPGACATERGQRPELSQRTSGTPLVQRPAMGAGPARATGAKGRTRATPAPAPSQPGKHQPGFIWRHVRLKNEDGRPKTVNSAGARDLAWRRNWGQRSYGPSGLLDSTGPDFVEGKIQGELG